MYKLLLAWITLLEESKIRSFLAKSKKEEGNVQGHSA